MSRIPLSILACLTLLVAGCTGTTSKQSATTTTSPGDLALHEENQTFHFKTTLTRSLLGPTSSDPNCITLPNGIHIQDGQAVLTWKSQSSMDANLLFWLLAGYKNNPMVEGASSLTMPLANQTLNYTYGPDSLLFFELTTEGASVQLELDLHLSFHYIGPASLAITTRIC